MEKKINLTQNPHLSNEKTEVQRQLAKKRESRADSGSSSFSVLFPEVSVQAFVTMRVPPVFSFYIPLNIFSVI